LLFLGIRLRRRSRIAVEAMQHSGRKSHRRQSQIVLASHAIVRLFRRRNDLQQPRMGH